MTCQWLSLYTPVFTLKRFRLRNNTEDRQSDRSFILHFTLSATHSVRERERDQRRGWGGRLAVWLWLWLSFPQGDRLAALSVPPPPPFIRTDARWGGGQCVPPTRVTLMSWVLINYLIIAQSGTLGATSFNAIWPRCCEVKNTFYFARL